jgi:O-antigen ligase
VAVAWVNQEFAVRYLRGAKRFVEVKFKYVDVASVAARSQYFLITAEIVAQHPLFGVSYGGFYDAAMQTQASRSDRAAVESPEAGAKGQSNPHSSLLYYASANGIPGILLTVTLLSFGLIILAYPMVRRGLPGLALWASFAFGYIIFGLTLPTLFNSSVFYLPVAIATCMRRPRFRYRRRIHTE